MAKMIIKWLCLIQDKIAVSDFSNQVIVQAILSLPLSMHTCIKWLKQGSFNCQE